MAQNKFVDDRAKQKSLIQDPDVVNRTEKESRIDRGSSNEFCDDRGAVEKSDPVNQSGLTADKIGDGKQRNLTGDIAAENPSWE